MNRSHELYSSYAPAAASPQHAEPEAVPAPQASTSGRITITYSYRCGFHPFRALPAWSSSCGAAGGSDNTILTLSLHTDWLRLDAAHAQFLLGAMQGATILQHRDMHCNYNMIADSPASWSTVCLMSCIQGALLAAAGV